MSIIDQYEQKLRNEVTDVVGDENSLTKQFMNKLGVLTTICSIIPSISLSTYIVDIIQEKIANVIKFLLELVVQVFGINLIKLRNLLSKFLIKEINIFSNSLNSTMSDKLKSCFLCKLRADIPDWLIDDGINLEIDSIDFRDMFKIHPESTGGKFIYGDERDMNRFLFNVVQDNGTSSTWFYNNKPIAKFKFIQSGAEVGYNVSKDLGIDGNEGSQNTDKRNNVLNMKIDSSYRGDNIVNFINDYIRSLDPIIQAKKVLPNILSKGYGVIPRLSNLSILSFRKQVTFDKTLELLLDDGAINDDSYEIDNTFLTFTNEEIKDIEDEVQNEYDGSRSLPSCCCAKSTISDISLISFNDRLQKSTTEEGDIQITNNALEQISKESVTLYPVNERNKGFLDFFTNIIQQIGVITTGMVITPKINFIIVMLNYMVTKNSRFINVREFFKIAWCVISDILLGIWRKLIYGLLLPIILKELIKLIKCAAAEIIRKRITDDILTYRSITPMANKRQLLFAKLVNALRSVDLAGVSQGITSGLINGAVDSVSEKVSDTLKNKENKE